MRENCDTGPSETASPLCAPPQRHLPALFLAMLLLITRKCHRPRCVPTEEESRNCGLYTQRDWNQPLGEMKLWNLKGACAFSIPRQLPSAFRFQCKCRRSTLSGHGTTSSSRVHSCLEDWTLHSAFQCMQSCHQDELYKRLGLIFMSPLSTASNICWCWEQVLNSELAHVLATKMC